MGYIDHVLQDAPYAYWPGQEASGATVMKDVVGAKHITFGNASPAAAGPGIIGANSAWQGATNAFGSVAFTWSPTTYSVEWWSYPLDAANYFCAIAGSTLSDYSASPNAWGSFVWHGHVASANCFFAGTDVSTRFTSAQTSGQYVSNTWVHWVFTYDGANGRIYKNGALLLGPQAMTAPAPFNGFELGGTNPSAYGFYGRIAHLALHGRALADVRVAARYREMLRGGVSY